MQFPNNSDTIEKKSLPRPQCDWLPLCLWVELCQHLTTTIPLFQHIAQNIFVSFRSSGTFFRGDTLAAS